jgi:hypothetical protein
MDEHHTFTFCAEIEESLVSVLWHKPDQMATFLQQCNPAVHLSQPHCQMLTEAINLSYSDHGNATWANVLQTIREMGRLEDCGGKDGLNRIYSDQEYTEFNPAILKDYIRSVKQYALNRGETPPKGTLLFTGGRGVATLQSSQRSGMDVYSGPAMIRGFRYQMQIQVPSGARSLECKFTPTTR